ncbi:MAG: RNA polymerase subunit sigma-70, partial [Sciscionella sp.]|nr:RNA polymerase subunit sigma-70 [Sciscionella sp.]
VLDQLTPAQRLAFVLHDLFGVPFEQIAPIVERSPAATRQLASRARRLVRGGGSGSADTVRQREVVDAFLAAARDGDFEALLRLLDPDIVLRADRVAVHAARNVDGAPLFAPEVHGVAAVAKVFSGRAAGAHAALIDGEIGAAWAPRGVPRSAFVMTIVGDKITAIDIVVERDALAELDVQILT